MPQAVFGGVIYNHALRYLRKSKQVNEVLGENFQVMNCNGMKRPMQKNVSFDIVAFGDNGRGKF